jgi:transposase-like protein
MKAKFKQILECPYCKSNCIDQSQGFHRCEKCDYNYFVDKKGNLENLPMTGVRSIRMVSDMISSFKERGILK